MFLTKHILAASVVLLVSTPASQALACKCARPSLTRAQLVERSRHVFFGTVQKIGATRGDPITITIDEVFKGDAGKRKVATLERGRRNSCSGPVPHEVGKTYMFFTPTLDGITSSMCRQTFIAMNAAPTDLNAWAGIRPLKSSVPESAPEPEAPAIEEPSEESPDGGVPPADVGVEGGPDVEAVVATSDEGEVAPSVDAPAADDEPVKQAPVTTPPKPAAGGCASVDTGAPGGPLHVALAFGVLAFGARVRRRLT